MKILKQLLFLFLLYLLADVITVRFFLPLPTTLVSMLLLIVLLRSGMVKEQQISEGSAILLEILPILFIPVGVAILEYVPLLQENLLSLSVIVVVSTLLTFVMTWLTTAFFTRKAAYGKHTK